MPAKSKAFSMNHPVIVTFLIFAIIGFMYATAEVLRPLALAVLLAFALAPVARRLERLRLPRTPAVILTVVATLGLLGGLGYVVGRQLNDLANNTDVEQFKRNLLNKFQGIKPTDESAQNKMKKAVTDVASTLSESPTSDDSRTVPVRIVQRPTIQERFQQWVGPYLEVAALGFFILILVMFMLINREDLSDRIIRLFGRGRISLTTRTMDEVGARISRYLAMFVTVNSTYGLIVGLGLWAIGIKYAVLWGVLAAMLRFIPYVGPATAFALPLLYSIANNPGWQQPLEVAALFGVIEVLANSFIEPLIYGHTTGVSALGLLVSAMFWTWLWGPVGLLLSTPLTVCLAVLGKYVPTLSFFATLLGEDAALEPDVRYYQRLLMMDQDGATEIVEDSLKQTPRVEVFDTILIPALSRAERDHARDEIDDREQAFLWRVTGDLIDDVEGAPDLSLQALAPAPDGPSKGAALPGDRPPAADAAPVKIAGIPANDTADGLALRMLGHLLDPSDCTLEVLDPAGTPLQVAEQVAEHAPDLILVSHLPPVGLAPVRYLVRRLRARFPSTPILVGRWGETGDSAALAEKLSAAGASHVVFSLADARARIQGMTATKAKEPTLAASSA